MADNTTGRPTTSTSTPLTYQDFSQQPRPFRRDLGPFDAGVTSLELGHSGTLNRNSQSSFNNCSPDFGRENHTGPAAAAAIKNSLGLPIAPIPTASLNNRDSIAPIALINGLSSSASKQPTDFGASEPFKVLSYSSHSTQNPLEHGDASTGAPAGGGGIGLPTPKQTEHQHTSPTVPRTTGNTISSFPPASGQPANDQASSANGIYRPGVASSNSPAVIKKPVLKMKRTGQNFPLSSSPGSFHQRNRSYSPSQRQGALTSRGSATGKAAALVTKGGQQPPKDGKVKSLDETSREKPSKALKVESKQGFGPNQDSTLKESSLISVESSVNGRGHGETTTAIHDSESDDIIYETAAQAGAVEGDLDDVIDHQFSSDDSDSQSEDDDETVEMDAGEASFRQLFRAPDQQDDYDDSENASAGAEDDDATSESSSDGESSIAEEPMVALPSANIQHQEAYPSTILEFAEPGRLYTEYRDNGVTVKAGPAMFPVGYTKSDVKDFPWLCAVRSCRLSYKTAAGLANHARFTHKKAMFNDNMDGTVSLVGSYSKRNQFGHYPPVIVSKRPLDPKEPPIREVAIPFKYHVSSKTPSNVRDVSQTTGLGGNDAMMGDGNTEGLEQEGKPPMLPAADPRTSEQMWEYIRPFLSKHKSIPEINWARHIIHLPRNRDIKWNEERNKEWPYKDSHPRDVTALIVQVTGVESPTPCEQCLRGRGPFIGCIVVSPDASDDVKSAVLSCANCYYHCNQSACSLCKSTVTRRERRSGARAGQKPDTYNVRLLSDVARRKPAKAMMGQAQVFSNSMASIGTPIQSKLRLYLPSEIQSIEKASSDRYYKAIKGLNGKDVPMCGALIPEKYDLDRTVPGYPWICPIRSCRRVFKKIVSLGPHFIRQHAGGLLNDNQDGTLSQVGYYDIPLPGNNSLQPLVISQNPLNPEEPPMKAPGLPGQGGHVPKLPKRKLLVNEPPGATRTRSRDLTTSDSTELWNYMRPYLPRSLTSISFDDPATRLFDLPRRREVQWRTKMHHNKVNDDRRQILGMVIYLTGKEHKNGEKSCTNCVKRNGPFPSCMTITDVAPDHIKSLVQACANCVFSHNASSCSIKSGWNQNANERSQVQATTKKRVLSTDNGNEGPATTRRRSDRRGFSDEEGKAEHRRRTVAMSMERHGQIPGLHEDTHYPLQTRVTSNGAAMKNEPSKALIHEGQFQADEMLEMEDWEIAPGRIRGAGADVNNNIAFSKSYLETNQAVRVSRDVTFEVKSIKSGHNLELEADQNKTRYCALASGKLYISVEDQEPFTIGPHGLFKVAPGSTAKIQNRLYIDSVLHISTFADG